MIDPRFIEKNDFFIVMKRHFLGFVASFDDGVVILRGRDLATNQMIDRFETTPEELGPVAVANEAVFRSFWAPATSAFPVLNIGNKKLSYLHPLPYEFVFICEDMHTGEKVVGGGWSVSGWHDFQNFLRKAELSDLADEYTDRFKKHYHLTKDDE